MSKNHRFKPASQQELSLYCLIGESVCAVQHLEDALSHSIVIMRTSTLLRKVADKLLEKHRKFTFGKAIRIAKQENMFPESLQHELSELLTERNWLIHKSIAQSRYEWDMNISREKLMNRIKAITIKSLELQQLIEEDLIEFTESKGVDMSQVRHKMNEYYSG